MTTVSMGYHPDLSTAQAMEIIARQFAGKYDVYKHTLFGLGRSFAVKKSAWEECLVRVEQKKGSTRFVLQGVLPPSILTFPLYVPAWYLLTMLFLRPRWKALEAEVASFIEGASEFK